VVHYTAGRDGTGPIEQGIANGFCYFVITKDGTIHQSFPLDEWGFHAGKSTFRGLGDGVSDNLVGIEVCCAGVVEPVKGTAKFKQWYEVNPEKHLNSAQVRTVPKTSKYPAPGTYERFTEAQEAALKKLLVWLHQNNPAVFSLDLVLGHDEVCVPAGRKTDPGGAISTPMPELRKLLKGLAGVK
jgi:N-acetyl-anhydromuramyl-L-alanine amidase AmpD